MESLRDWAVKELRDLNYESDANHLINAVDNQASKITDNDDSNLIKIEEYVITALAESIGHKKAESFAAHLLKNICEFYICADFTVFYKPSSSCNDESLRTISPALCRVCRSNSTAMAVYIHLSHKPADATETASDDKNRADYGIATASEEVQEFLYGMEPIESP